MIAVALLTCEYNSIRLLYHGKELHNTPFTIKKKIGINHPSPFKTMTNAVHVPTLLYYIFCKFIK